MQVLGPAVKNPLSSLARWVGYSMPHSHRWSQEIRRWLDRVLPPVGNKWLLKFLPWAMLGVVLSGSCHLHRIAAALPALGTVKCVLQRLSRWLSRPSFDLSPVLASLAANFAARQGGGQIILCVDRTEWKHANVLYAAVPFRGRALPVARLVLAGPKATHSRELRELLAIAAQGLPAQAEVVVLADREFGNVPAMRVIGSFGWHFCLRFKQDTWVCDAEGGRWQVRDRHPARGKTVRWSGVQVTGHRFGPVQLVMRGADQADEPWVLVSDLPAPGLELIYRRRMLIDAMFSDLKQRGFDLESTRLRDGLRLGNLLALLSLAYLWLLWAASVVVRRGWPRRVDRARRRDLSYLQIAARFLIYHPPETAIAIAAAIARGAEQK